MGFLKVTTIFIFSAALFAAAPTFHFDPKQPVWVAPAGPCSFERLETSRLMSESVAVLGAIPMLYMMYFASPFVAYIHIMVPFFARRSREQLLKWAQNIPPSIEIEMTTIKSYGGLRTTRMPIGQIRPTTSRFGIQNFVRVPNLSKRKPWWAPKDQRLFFIGSERKKTVETAVWQNIRSQIQDSHTNRPGQASN